MIFWNFSACQKDLNAIDSNVASGFAFPNINPRNGHYLVGTEVRYTCNTGYEPSNGGVATCTADGNWNPPVECK